MISADIELSILDLCRRGSTDGMTTMRRLDAMLRRIGTKKNPDTYDGFTVHSDGMFVEFAPIEALPDASTMIQELQRGAWVVSSILEIELADLRAPAHGVETLSPDELEAAGIIGGRLFHQLIETGCSPDYQADAVERCSTRRSPVSTKLMERQLHRECGGHIHLDLPYDSKQALCSAVCAFEEVLRYESESKYLYDSVDRHGSHYRVSNLYRPKPYGFEYRSLPPAWMMDIKVAPAIERAHAYAITQARG